MRAHLSLSIYACIRSSPRSLHAGIEQSSRLAVFSLVEQCCVFLCLHVQRFRAVACACTQTLDTHRYAHSMCMWIAAKSLRRARGGCPSRDRRHAAASPRRTGGRGGSRTWRCRWRAGGGGGWPARACLEDKIDGEGGGEGETEREGGEAVRGRRVV
eukprot:3285390-Prymnesium_polylepis.2